MEENLFYAWQEVKDYLEEIAKDCSALLFSHKDNLGYKGKEEKLTPIHLSSNIRGHGPKEYAWIKEVQKFDDDFEYNFQFQIINTGKVSLPSAIKKLIIYAGTDDRLKASLIEGDLSEDTGSMFRARAFNEDFDEVNFSYEEVEDKDGIIQFRKTKSLPDYYTIEYEHSLVLDFCQRVSKLPSEKNKVELSELNFLSDFKLKKLKNDYEVYEIIKKKVLKDKMNDIGFNNNFSFIGGYISQLSNLANAPKGYDFLMQFGTNWGNQDMLYVFYNPNSKKPFYIDVVH